MIIKGIIDEDFVNYYKCSMFIAFPYCSFKCERECGLSVCQNSALTRSNNLYFESNSLVDRFLENDLSEAVVLGGLEPLDSWDDVIEFITDLRARAVKVPIIIYTGYNLNEIEDKKIELLKNYKNIILKVGRFIPDKEKKIDPILKVYLASPNQYAIEL